MRTTCTLTLLLALVACGGDDRPERAERRARTLSSRASAAPDTAVFVAQQAGEPAPVSAVMQLRAAGRDVEVTIGNEVGQAAVAGAPAAEAREEIAGSRARSEADSTAPVASWRATVTVPVLEGERYLLEVFPASPRVDSLVLDLSADGRRLGASQVAFDATQGVALFEVAIGRRSLTVGPQIEPVEIVPTCALSHVIRSGGRADLYAQYEVVETGERGDVHLPPRDVDARFRSVTLATKTHGTLSISYLGRELASAARPEACPPADAP